MSEIDEQRLMAYLDGELNAASRAQVEQALAGDAELRRRLETQRRLRETLAAHYDPVAQEEVPERFRAMLEPPVVDLAGVRAARQGRLAIPWPQVVALAATLVLGLVLGRALPEGGPVAIDNGAIVAQGALADTLDTQLASTQPADAPTRIGVTFARADGRLCRTFESRAVTGLACRRSGDWQLVMTAPGTTAAQTEYRQAGSGGMAVLQAAQDVMAGEPFDAAAEQRARDAGWRSVAEGN